MKTLRFAFAGFRHAHVMDVYEGAQASETIEIVACSENDASTRSALEREQKVALTHTNCLTMLDEVACDVVVVGDVYGARGALTLEALKRGKHVLSDKPVCTRMEELDAIEKQLEDRNTVLGCQFDMRDRGMFIKLRELIRSNALGEVHAVTIGGQHPLLPDTRPGWYFEQGAHGGTINDIGIHAMDLLPWMTGLAITDVVAARSWNALARDTPYMHDAGQFVLRMHNGCGVMADVSYLMPGPMGYTMEHYWRVSVWGSEGMAETSMNSETVSLWRLGDQHCENIPKAPDNKRGYLQAFIDEVQGKPQQHGVTTADVLAATRMALSAQSMGENQR